MSDFIAFRIMSCIMRVYSNQRSSCRAEARSPSSSWRRELPWLANLTSLSRQKLEQIAYGIGSATLAAAVAFSILASPVSAVTNEQLLFLEAWRAVDRAYYDKNFNGKPWFKIREQMLKSESLGTRQETYAAIRSLLQQLDDPFTRFLEPSRYAALKRGTAGSLTGVGLEVGFDMGAGTDSDLVVITPSADGPADKAGIRPRDQVVQIDGKPTKGISLYDAGELLQGNEGSQVTLTIRPHEGGEVKDYVLSRQRLTFNPVTSQLCKKVSLGSDEAGLATTPSGKVGYIRVATFSKQTTDNVKTALHQLQAEGADRYVLDIRNNGGGLFPAGVEVARMLMKDGDIVLIADSQGVRDSYSANGIAVETAAPLSVLVNRGTASASEVLAGALKDNLRGVVVGETTFGKGLIQTIVEMSDGSGVAVTVARYQTPDGTDINKKGITPDISLKPDQMPPANGPGFCKYVAAVGANVLFDTKAADALKSNASAEGLAVSTEEAAAISKPIDVTKYENAMPGTGVSTPTNAPSIGDEAPSSAAIERSSDKAREEKVEMKSEETAAEESISSDTPPADKIAPSPANLDAAPPAKSEAAGDVTPKEPVRGDAGTVGGDEGLLDSSATVQTSVDEARKAESSIPPSAEASRAESAVSASSPAAESSPAEQLTGETTNVPSPTEPESPSGPALE